MSSESSSPRYRRRNRWPIAVLLVVLLVATITVWTQILGPDPAAAAGCNGPASAGGSAAASPATESSASTTRGTTASTGHTTASHASTSLGHFQQPSSLADIRPADPGRVPLRVLNASGVTGEAGTVTRELRSAGFGAIGQAENDPLYPDMALRCYGEIRYGYAGLSEARTVLMVAPCAQLVRDDRMDNSVDLSLGKRYDVEPVSDKVRKELKKVANASAPPPVVEGQTLSVRSAPSIPPLPERGNCPD